MAAVAATAAAKRASSVRAVRALGFPFQTLDPFLFCVHHKDLYPKGDGRMRVPGVSGNGQDFDFARPYRMYHGTHGIPGFPQHPHRGFETLTATTMGTIDHSDSMGSAGRYGGGDLQWMTAGGGVVHGEMFPLIHDDKENHMELFQIWLNLPKKSKMVKASYVMHWREEVPVVTTDEGRVSVTVWAGEFEGKKGLAPPPDSWASHPESDIAVWNIVLAPGATVEIPAAAGGASTNRALYFYDGDDLQIESQTIKPRHMIELKSDQPAMLHVPTSATQKTGVLMLQGRPIGEPVVQHGPFVMNTQAEIRQAFMDYQRTQFGGWPWPKDDMSFPAEKGRFTLQDGVESFPPGLQIAVGTEVTLSGLQSNPDLNGRRGKVLNVDVRTNGRYGIELLEDGPEPRVIAIKPENLVENA